MNDAIHGREAWSRPGKRDRGRRREVGSRVSAHNGPGEATLTPSILVRIQVPQPASHVSGVLFPGWRDPPTFPRVRRARPTRFAAETVSCAISAAAVTKISSAPFRG